MKSFKEKFREDYDKYYDKYVKPYDSDLEAIEEKINKFKENPESEIKNFNINNVSKINETNGKLKDKVENGLKNLLLAHAGASVLVINLLPDLIDKKELLPLAINALNNFAWGLILLFVSAVIMFLSELIGNIQSMMKELGGGNSFIIKHNFTGMLLVFSSTCILISLYLFASAILSASIELRSLIWMIINWSNN